MPKHKHDLNSINNFLEFLKEAKKKKPNNHKLKLIEADLIEKKKELENDRKSK